MPVRRDTWFERLLAPMFGNILIDREALLAYRNRINWPQECDRLTNPTVDYPAYYQRQNFHGVTGGYLSIDAAVTYDPITQYVLPPNETWVRQGLIERIQSKPRRILDLGCGTGSTTLLLKQAFPQAEVIGLDLSPYMLIVAEDKAHTAHIDIAFRHAAAEQTGFPDGTFDLVTASLLFHETPAEASLAILRESFRLLRTGGEIAILDGNQSTLRSADWLMDVFEEPYIRDYASGSVAAWMGEVGFGAVRTDDLWWVHQVVRGVKPLPYQRPEFSNPAELLQTSDRQWALGAIDR